MLRISKNHDAYKMIRDAIKTNNYPNLTITSDLQILKIAIDFKLKINTLLYSYEENFKPETLELLNELIANSANSYEISLASFNQLALKENSAGIIAAIEIPKYTLNDFLNREFIFVLDKLEIPGNIGTIYRTLDSISCDGVILCDPITKLHNPKLTSSSRGCSLIIPTIAMSYNDTLNFLIENDYQIFLGEPKLGLDYQKYDYKGKIAIIVGNERFGINNDWYNHKHNKVFIPMEGNQNSLNVGVAASILGYEAYMKRKNK